MRKLTVWQLAQSALAAALGVQSSKNRKRDFESGSYKPFLVAGVVMAAVWYGSIYFVVKVVLA